jgi:hypothetical protein
MRQRWVMVGIVSGILSFVGLGHASLTLVRSIPSPNLGDGFGYRVAWTPAGDRVIVTALIDSSAGPLSGAIHTFDALTAPI